MTTKKNTVITPVTPIQSTWTQNNTDDEECTITSELMVTFRVTRCLGMTPIQIRRAGGLCYMSLSKPGVIWTCIVLLIVDVCAFVVKLYKVPKSEMPLVVILVNIGFVFTLLLMNQSLFTARRNAKCILSYLNQVQKVTSRFDPRLWTSSDRLIHVPIAITLVYLTFMVLMSTYVQLREYRLIDSALKNLKWAQLQQVGDHILLYWFALVVYLLIIQFSYILLHGKRAFELMNAALEDLKRRIDVKDSTYQRLVARDVVSTVSWGYQQISKEMNILYDSHGAVLFYTVCAVIILIVENMYYFAASETLSAYQWYFTLGWTVNHVVILVAAVEPSSMVNSQIVMLGRLSCELGCRVTSPELQHELDVLTRQLRLNKVTSAPLNLFVLNRSLVVTVLGAAISYLLIVVQFGKTRRRVDATEAYLSLSNITQEPEFVNQTYYF